MISDKLIEAIAAIDAINKDIQQHGDMGISLYYSGDAFGVRWNDKWLWHTASNSDELIEPFVRKSIDEWESCPLHHLTHMEMIERCEDGSRVFKHYPSRNYSLVLNNFI